MQKLYIIMHKIGNIAKIMLFIAKQFPLVFQSKHLKMFVETAENSTKQDKYTMDPE